MNTITLKQNNWQPKKYHLIREERNQWNGLRNENMVEALIGIEPFTSSDTNEILFRIKMNNYKQTNTKGMYKWVGLLHTLRKNLIISVDDNGMLKQVKNMDVVREEWAKIKDRVYEEQKKESNYSKVLIKGIQELINDTAYFSRNLKFSYPYLYLFPPIFNNPLFLDKKKLGYRELPHLLNIKKVPITTEEYIKNYNSDSQHIEIEVEGKIDENNFEQDKLTELIKILKNRPRVPTLAKLNYLERYRFNDKHQLIQGMCMSLLTVPGSLYREEKTILRQI